MSAGAVWAQYHTGTWHAWDPGEERSVCRSCPTRPEGPEASRPGPGTCRVCAARVRRRGRSPLAEPHREGVPCACPGCREARREAAATYAAGLASVIPACRCVREWPQAGRFVAEPEAECAALLLAWELSGRSVEARDVEDAGRVLLESWRAAAMAYELLDGSHPHGPRRRP